ncbi:MAG: hypothetical protein K6G75_07525 [Lachnospiraceae bacterium]|nr:hypothetical protein [Lachnospiraceae bacterium]
MNYFIEGLQGSGKSTLVKNLSDIHPECVAIREGEYSPTELAWCAYLDEKTYKTITEKYPEMKEEIANKTYSEGDRRIVCYTRIMTDNHDFYKDLEKYEIYNNRVSLEDFKSIILSRYKAWNQDNMIFECSLFQNIVEDMILFRNAFDDEIIDFYRQIRDTLEGKNYKILYLKAEDVRGNLDVIRKERSDENGNELWFPLMMGFFNDSLFAKENGLSGEEELIKHFIHRQNLELRICHEVFEGKYSILNSKKYTDEDLSK